MTQLAIPFPPRAARSRADFLVSECNRAALQWIERWPDWPGRRLVLYGPEGCGKTHLAQLWAERSGAVAIGGRELAQGKATETGASAGAMPPAIVVDDAEAAPEVALLHLYNRCGEAGAGLLLIARAAPAGWPIGLPDLASRLRATAAARITAPDDALLGALLVKHFADRQLRVEPAIMAYLVPRMERSFAALAALVERLDRLALERRCAVGLALARAALAEAAAPERQVPSTIPSNESEGPSSPLPLPPLEGEG